MRRCSSWPRALRARQATRQVHPGATRRDDVCPVLPKARVAGFDHLPAGALRAVGEFGPAATDLGPAQMHGGRHVRRNKEVTYCRWESRAAVAVPSRVFSQPQETTQVQTRRIARVFVNGDRGTSAPRGHQGPFQRSRCPAGQEHPPAAGDQATHTGKVAEAANESARYLQELEAG